MNLSCFACGARFRSMGAEARHRHNFPAMCKRNKRFAKFLEENEREAARKRVAEFRAKHPELAEVWKDILERAST